MGHRIISTLSKKINRVNGKLMGMGVQSSLDMDMELPSMNDMIGSGTNNNENQTDPNNQNSGSPSGAVDTNVGSDNGTEQNPGSMNGTEQNPGSMNGTDNTNGTSDDGMQQNSASMISGSINTNIGRGTQIVSNNLYRRPNGINIDTNIGKGTQVVLNNESRDQSTQSDSGTSDPMQTPENTEGTNTGSSASTGAADSSMPNSGGKVSKNIKILVLIFMSVKPQCD